MKVKSESEVVLTRYDGELREPLVWRQGSQVSMPMVRCIVSLLLSHGRGIGPQDAVKKDSQGLSQNAAKTVGFSFPQQVACPDDTLHIQQELHI